MAFTHVDHYDPSTGGHSGVRTLLEPRELLAIELLREPTATEGGALLDIGCGTGIFLSELDRVLGLAQSGWQIHGVDVSEAQIAQASRYPYSFAQCNVEDGLPFEDESLDVIFAGELIEHLYDPDRFLEDCQRALKPGGHLLLTTPNLHAWYNRALFPLGIQPVFYETSTRSTLIGAGPLRRLKHGSVPVGHVRLFNRRALNDLLESQGFRPIAWRGSVFTVLPKPLLALDRILARAPALASNLVVLAHINSAMM